MNKMLLMFSLFMLTNISYSEQQVNHAALQGVWTYFHITTDFFTDDKMVGAEQRLFFQDGQNITLTVLTKENEYLQSTSYKLNYTLSLRDNVPYITLFSTESKQVLGAYLRIPYEGSLEMAGDPSFATKKQLYQRQVNVIEESLSLPKNITNSTTNLK